MKRNLEQMNCDSKAIESRSRQLRMISFLLLLYRRLLLFTQTSMNSISGLLHSYNAALSVNGATSVSNKHPFHVFYLKRTPASALIAGAGCSDGAGTMECPTNCDNLITNEPGLRATSTQSHNGAYRKNGCETPAAQHMFLNFHG